MKKKIPVKEFFIILTFKIWLNFFLLFRPIEKILYFNEKIQTHGIQITT